MRAGALRRRIGAGSRIGCILDIDFRKVDVAADQYFMDRSVYGHRCQRKADAHWHLDGWDLDGVVDYVYCGQWARPTHVTIEALICPTTVAGERCIYGWNELSSYTLFYVKDGKIKFQWSQSGGNYRVYESAVVIPIGTHCVAARQVSNTLPFGYHNGCKTTMGLTMASGSDALPTGDKFSAIGRPGEYDGLYFTGLIGLVRIYNQAEYAAKILQRAIDSRRN